ncbi:MAG: precorrin-6x reductase [Draconibacterium sp.]|nr:MAG: precorrin-6x reductase [Draconibacterium sp.]
MILVFGGTTEGKIAAELLDYMQLDYFYSTKEITQQQVKGTMISGAKTTDDIIDFCKNNHIKLLVDAAHPFAAALHKSVYETAMALELKLVRFERKSPKYDYSQLRFFDSFTDLNQALLDSNYQRLLFLSGVQTIPHFSAIWKTRDAYFRILKTAVSKAKAKSYGIPMHRVIPMQPEENDAVLQDLAKQVNAEIFISKESGASGFFEQKVKTAKALNIPFWAVKRPTLPDYEYVAYNKKEMLQHLYKMEKLLFSSKDDLKSGFTTGTCVLAAAKACFLAIFEQQFPEMVTVTLPSGDMVNYYIFPEYLKEKEASCVVIKYAGDDPDVTHGKEIGCTLKISESEGVHFLKGKGVGVATLPGLQVKVGEPAINNTPRKLITEQMQFLAEEYNVLCNFDVIPFVPEGEELAEHTFNPRVGIVGGISIIGTTGKVMPFSNTAFLSSIRQQLSVVQQNSCDTVVLTSGKRSQNRMMPLFPKLEDYAYIHFGNSIGDTIKMAVEMKIRHIHLAIMFGKGIKLAEGHLDTHSRSVVFNPKFAAKTALQNGCSTAISEQIKMLKLANAIVPILPFAENKAFYNTIAQYCYNTCAKVQN